MESSSEKSVRLPTFDDKEKNFRIWWKRFMGYAGLYKFKQALVAGGKSCLPEKGTIVPDVQTADGKAQKQALWRNEVAMANFAMALTTEGLINMLDLAMSEDWPDGKAHLVVEALFAKEYEPKDVMSLVELQDALHGVSMKKDEAPSELFENLKSIENRFASTTTKVTEAELIAAALRRAAPSKYRAVLSCEQSLKGNALKLDDLEKAMTRQWRQERSSQHKDDESDDDEGGEVSLSAFQGNCFKCKQKGHRADNCPKKNKGMPNGGNNQKGKSKFSGKCFNCGKAGH
jgi:hypothetical protein